MSEIFTRDVHILLHWIEALQVSIHEENKKWWYDNEGNRLTRNKGEMLALIHSEISEALEGVRKDKMDEHLPQFKNEVVELADAVIRILDYAHGHGYAIGPAIVQKILFNRSRADHQREARERAGGKAF